MFKIEWLVYITHWSNWMLISLKENPIIASFEKIRRLNVVQQNSNILEMWETVSKTRQEERRQCGARSGVINTQNFLGPTTHPWVKKLHSLTLNTKLQLQLTMYTLVQDMRLTTKKYVCTVKD